MVDLKTLNILMTTSEITPPEPSPLPSTNLKEKQTCMSDLDTAHRTFANTSEEKFQNQ